MSDVKNDSAQQLAIDLQEMQRRAFALGLPLTAKALNDAMNKIGYEQADNIKRSK